MFILMRPEYSRPLRSFLSLECEGVLAVVQAQPQKCKYSCQERLDQVTQGEVRRRLDHVFAKALL